MFRIGTGVAAALLIMGVLTAASAQTTAPAPSAPAASSEAKPSKAKLTAQKLKDMKAKWGKLKACRQEVKAKGLAGDDRWFYIEDCMGKT
jgi:hypothetical protein